MTSLVVCWYYPDMSKPFVTCRRVEFCDTDLAGIVHFSNYYRYMEKAEHDYFRSLSLKIHGRLPDGTAFGWPRVSASCVFRAPARYDDEIEIQVDVLNRTARSLTTGSEFRCGHTVLAIGEMKTTYCVISAEGRLESTNMPAEYVDRLGTF